MVMMTTLLLGTATLHNNCDVDRRVRPIVTPCQTCWSKMFHQQAMGECGSHSHCRYMI